MERILFIAPSSYPINGPEAMVNAKHIYVLTQMGCSVDLVCRGIREMSNFYPSESSNIPYFFRGLKSINVVKVDTQMNLSTLYRHIKALIKTGYVYKASDWSYDAIKFCEEKLDIKNYDFVLTKDYPSEVVGLYLSKKYNLKWIPTWNDPYMWKKYPAPYGKGANYKEGFLHKRLIKDISRYTYKNIFPSERLKNYMLTYMYGMKPENCIIMPHIMIENSSEVHTSNNNGELNIIHAGSIGIQRNPINLFVALSLFKTKYPQRKISITFLGIIMGLSEEYIYSEINRLDIGNIIKFEKPVKYDESHNIIEKFDVCMVLEAPCQEGIFLPSKLIDYLQIQKPIFTLSPLNGTLNDLYHKGIVDYFADVTNVEDILHTLEKLYNDYSNNNLIKRKDLSEFSVSNIINLHKNIIFK